MSSNRAISVILCCARADTAHVRPLAERLRKDGTKVQLLEGIDEDPHLLGASLDLEQGACMFVTCLSDTLGPKDFRRLTGIYSARKGPQHYLADIMVEPDEVPAMLENINVALGRAAKVIGSGERAKRANNRGPARLRDVVGVTDISAVAKTPANRGRPAAAKPSASADIVERRPREQSVAGPYVISSRAAAEPAAAESGARRIEPPTATEPAAAESAVQPKPVATAQGSSNWMPAVLFLILVAVAGTVALLSSQNRDHESDRGVPKPAVIAATNDAPKQAEANVEAPADVEPTPEAEAAPNPEPTVDEAAVIRESIAAGELRAIDLILVANPDARASWREASNLCKAKSHRGVRGWRLPTLEELKTIRNARMLDADRYWSGTLAPQVGDGSDHVFVLDLKARTLDPVPKDASDVRMVCVRAALP
jgi:hypothetical protein